MAKKTLRIPYKMPPPRVCCVCGKELRRRDIAVGSTRQIDTDRIICSYCVVNAEDPPWPIGDDNPNQAPLLREIKDVRQVLEEPIRRWYSDGQTDLIVWLDVNRVLGFQLAVPSDDGQMAITWSKEQGLSVADIDDGECRPLRPKMTPVLVARQSFDAAAVLALFKGVSDGLPAGLAEGIKQRILESTRGNDIEQSPAGGVKKGAPKK